MDQTQIMIKILSIGDSQSGKSCIIKKYCEGRFIQKYITTIGVDYGVKKMTIKNKLISINFFDMSGEESYEIITKEFYKDSQGIILVIDLGNKKSFKNIQMWEKKCKENGCDLKNAVTYLCANKNDLQKKEIEISEIQKYAKKQGYEFIVTSAATGENIQTLFEQLFNKVVDQIDQQL